MFTTHEFDKYMEIYRNPMFEYKAEFQMGFNRVHNPIGSTFGRNIAITQAGGQSLNTREIQRKSANPDFKIYEIASINLIGSML